MNNKGFTLIELLSVIVVLAIILIIAVPRVLDVIEEADKEAFRMTGEQLIKGAKDRLEMNSMYPQDDKTYTINNGAFVGDSIPMSGELPDNGVINITSNGVVSIAVSDDTWCAIKYEDEDNVFVSKDPDCQLYIPEVVADSCFTRTNDGTQVTITDYNAACSKNVIIPNTLDGLPVRILGTGSYPLYGFYLKNLTSVAIPNSVTSIGNSAFSGNNLTRISLPSTVTSVGGQAFYTNKISNLSLSDGLISIGEAAFYGNSLTSVTLPNSVTSIGQRAFQKNFDSISLESTLKNVTLSSNLISIGDYAFEYNAIRTIILPNSLVSIGEHAFSSNKLTNIVIPNSAISIGGAAFNDNQLPDNKAFIYARNPDGSENLTTIVSYGGAKRDNVVIPEGVLILDDYSFHYNQLTSVTIPESVTSIGDHVFAYNSLVDVIIPNSVTSIGNSSFSPNFDFIDWESTLKNVTLSNNLTSIGDYAFRFGVITNLVIPASVNHIGVSAFNDNLLLDNQAFIYARNPDGSKDLSTIISYGGAKKENVVIPNGVVTIGLETFRYTSISSVTIPGTVTTIGDSSFRDNNLTSITIPNGVVSIGIYAFQDNDITEVILPNTLISIGDTAFIGLDITNLIIPNSVTSIGSSAFSMNKLTNLVLTNSLISLGEYVFSNNLLTNIVMPANVNITNSMISNSFRSSYVTVNARAAGTYTAASQTGAWTKQ